MELLSSVLSRVNLPLMRWGVHPFPLSEPTPKRLDRSKGYLYFGGVSERGTAKKIPAPKNESRSRTSRPATKEPPARAKRRGPQRLKRPEKPGTQHGPPNPHPIRKVEDLLREGYRQAAEGANPTHSPPCTISSTRCGDERHRKWAALRGEPRPESTTPCPGNCVYGRIAVGNFAEGIVEGYSLHKPHQAQTW